MNIDELLRWCSPALIVVCNLLVIENIFWSTSLDNEYQWNQNRNFGPTSYLQLAVPNQSEVHPYAKVVSELRRKLIYVINVFFYILLRNNNNWLLYFRNKYLWTAIDKIALIPGVLLVLLFKKYTSEEINPYFYFRSTPKCLKYTS